jgi:hemoglobin-like flavoprotein
MNQHQVALVQSSWEKVIPIADIAADVFYEKLFEMDGSLRALFPQDMKEQKKKLLSTLGRVVSSLDRLPDVLPAVRALGRKHVGYGVKPQHYQVVGAALLATLEVGLGDAFSNEVRVAWADTYGALAKAMSEAANSASAMNMQAVHASSASPSP